MHDIPVIYLKVPGEQPRFIRELVARYKPNLQVIRLVPGEDKRQALNRAVKKLGLDGVFFGIHRYQSDHRATKRLVEYDDSGSRPFCRLHPVLDWGSKFVGAHFVTHKLLYPAGHFPGTRIQEKECGLHCPVPDQALAS
jgi:3'-phosphoadenosine 5'-phosphosulfate sulfotransferase (PAPS reductase)/FAD synthetase